MNLVPLSNHVVVRRDNADETSKGGIVIPDVARQEKPSKGRVLAVGPGKMTLAGTEWKHEPMAVKEGQTVLFSRYGGQEIELDGEKLTILTDDNIMAIVG
jgi:chaperonin GroES